MSCETCDEGDMGGHKDEECIWVKGRAFCPVTHEEIHSPDEVEEMSEEETNRPNAKIILVRAASWKILEAVTADSAQKGT